MTAPHRVCPGCGGPLSPWPAVAAACHRCLDRLPTELRDRYEHSSGSAWAAAFDTIRVWLAEHPRV